MIGTLITGIVSIVAFIGVALFKSGKSVFE